MSNYLKLLLVSLCPDEQGDQIEEAWFKKALTAVSNCYDLTVINGISKTLPLPEDFDGIILGGCPYSVCKICNEPWAIKLKEFVLKTHSLGIPLLGVCFGHQFIANCFGSRIDKNLQGWEIGSCEIELTQCDLLFSGLPKQFNVSQSHEDIVFDLGEGIEVLAHNHMSKYQALKIGATTRTVQFHPEIGFDEIGRTVARRFSEGQISDSRFQEVMSNLKDTKLARLILANFMRYFVAQYRLKYYNTQLLQA